MERIGIIKPEYVWLTSGVGKWTNEKAAEVLAKRKAGIDKYKLIDVARVLNSNFRLVDEVEFNKKSSNTKYAYIYGTIIQVTKGESIRGDISLINEKEWGSIMYYYQYGDGKDLSSSKKEIIQEYESLNKSTSPTPLTRYESISNADSNYHYCLILAAMIIGEPH